MRPIIIIVLSILILSICDSVHSKIEKLVQEIEYAEKNQKQLYKEDWYNIEKQMD